MICILYVCLYEVNRFSKKIYTKFYTSDIMSKNDKEEVIYVWFITTG